MEQLEIDDYLAALRKNEETVSALFEAFVRLSRTPYPPNRIFVNRETARALGLEVADENP